MILIDRDLDPATRVCVLGHELIHLERGGSGWMPGLPEPMRVLITREERRVERIVAERLLPVEELGPWVHARAEVEPVTPQLVADEFGVTAAVATEALRRLAA